MSSAAATQPLRFVDTTLRDAHQSLWNGRMTTAMMLPIAPSIARDAGLKPSCLLRLNMYSACLFKAVKHGFCRMPYSVSMTMPPVLCILTTASA